MAHNLALNLIYTNHLSHYKICLCTDFFRSFFTVSSYTALSRVLGLIRDIFIAKYLGSTVTADAFFVAFRLPNFFRRVLAEGAYSAALIPVFSGVVIDSKDDKEAADFVENTMSFLLCVTVLLTIIFLFWYAFYYSNSSSWIYG